MILNKTFQASTVENEDSVFPLAQSILIAVNINKHAIWISTEKDRNAKSGQDKEKTRKRKTFETFVRSQRIFFHFLSFFCMSNVGNQLSSSVSCINFMRSHCLRLAIIFMLFKTDFPIKLFNFFACISS